MAQNIQSLNMQVGETQYTLTLPEKIYDELGLSINRFAELLARDFYCPTLTQAPTEDTLTYSDTDGSVNHFQIGQPCRWEENGSYEMAMLASLSENKAVWMHIPSEGDDKYATKDNNVSSGGTINLYSIEATTLAGYMAGLGSDEVRLYFVTDSSGNLPSLKGETFITVSGFAKLLLFGKTESFGVSVGDILAVSKMICRIIPLNDAKPATSTYGNVGADGLMTAWDKGQVNQIAAISSAAYAALPKTDALPYIWLDNMNDALSTGVYPWCTLGRPTGSTGAYTCVVKRSSTVDSNGYYTIEQTAYGREAELGKVYKRIIFWKDSSTHEYGNWIEVSSTGSVDWSNVSSKPTTLEGYGITDAYTKTAADERYLKLTGGTINGWLDVDGDFTVIGNIHSCKKLSSEGGAEFVGRIGGLDSLGGNTVWEITSDGKAHLNGLHILPTDETYGGMISFGDIYPGMPYIAEESDDALTIHAMNGLYISNNVYAVKGEDDDWSNYWQIMDGCANFKQVSVMDKDDNEVSFISPTVAYIGTPLRIVDSIGDGGVIYSDSEHVPTLVLQTTDFSAGDSCAGSRITMSDLSVYMDGTLWVWNYDRGRAATGVGPGYMSLYNDNDEENICLDAYSNSWIYGNLTLNDVTADSLSLGNGLTLDFGGTYKYTFSNDSASDGLRLKGYNENYGLLNDLRLVQYANAYFQKPVTFADTTTFNKYITAKEGFGLGDGMSYVYIGKSSTCVSGSFGVFRGNVDNMPYLYVQTSGINVYNESFTSVFNINPNNGNTVVGGTLEVNGNITIPVNPSDIDGCTYSINFADYGSIVGLRGNEIDILCETAWIAVQGGTGVLRTDILQCEQTVQLSDYNLKTILGDVRLSLNEMANAPLVRFEWNDRTNKNPHVGTIAQYWKDCLPEVVSTTKEETLSLSYADLGVAMGISLAKEMVDMEERIKNLEEKLNNVFV